jgi:carbamoyl-phosphate synthase large subunit
MEEKSLTVLITGVGGGGHGEQVLKALKLAKTHYTIIGADMSHLSMGLLEVDLPYIVPPATHPDYIDVILKICKKHDVKVLFHGSEPELKVMSENRARIESEGIFLPINPNEVLSICMDKSKTVNFLKENNFSYPKSVTVREAEDIEKIDFLPAVLKPSIGAGGSANILLAQTQGELEMFGNYLLTIYKEFIVQEYVGSPESEFTVGVLISMDGELINSIAVRRSILSTLSNRIKVTNQTGNDNFGNILAISNGVSQGEIGKFPEVTKQCEDIAMKMGCRGSVNVQCRLVDGKVFVFEINPRFSGTTSLRAMVGYNEPDTLIRKHLFKEDIEPHFDYKSGFIMRGLKEAFINKETLIPYAIEL